MKALDARKAFQAVLGTAQDGIIGPNDRAAIELLAKARSDEEWPLVAKPGRKIEAPPNARVVPRGPDWKFDALVDGDDLLLINVKATAFGGDNDSMDSGETASGYNTKGHPELVAVSLPMSNDRVRDSKHGFVLKDSPIPKMPFGLRPSGADNPSGCHVDVEFIGTGVFVENVPCIDLGPADWTGCALDCSVALARKVNPKATANSFGARVNVRIRGAAKFLS